jgi:hypothetical protein
MPKAGGRELRAPRGLERQLRRVRGTPQTTSPARKRTSTTRCASTSTTSSHDDDKIESIGGAERHRQHAGSTSRSSTRWLYGWRCLSSDRHE